MVGLRLITTATAAVASVQLTGNLAWYMLAPASIGDCGEGGRHSIERAFMRQFRIAVTGDFLNEQLALAYGDIGLRLLDCSPLVRYHFLADQAPQLDLMKPTAYLVNVARGELLDQAALLDCLERRRIGGAALDVFEMEPLPAEDPLTRLDNAILTPHWVASTSDVWRATGEAMARGMLRAARGEVPDNVVNPEVISRPGFRSKLARFRANQSSLV
jgi:hypothetical protein